MNIERFHNELAIRLGYERIVNDKRILISVDESDEPCVTIKLLGHEVIEFMASGMPEEKDLERHLEIREDIMIIADAVHQAYVDATTSRF